MNTRYSNNGDKLETFYREKFEDYSCEPFPDAFEKINKNLSSETSIFSKINQNIIDKFGANRILTSLQVSLLVNFITIAFLFYSYVGQKETAASNDMMKEQNVISEDVQTLSNPKEGESSKKSTDIKPMDKKETSVIANKKENNFKPNNNSHVGITKEELKKTLIPTEEEHKGTAKVFKIDSIGPILNSNPIEPAKKENYKDNLEDFYNQHAEKLKDSTKQLFIKKK